MKSIVRFCAAITFAASVVAVCRSSIADEGMWLFNNLPVKYLKNKYGFEPDAAWADQLMKSCVRFNNGGSASFVSSTGLVLTNHHVGRDMLHKVSTAEHNYAVNGFLAKSLDEEIPAPDLELNQLISIEDVTAQVDTRREPRHGSGRRWQSPLGQNGPNRKRFARPNRTSQRCDHLVRRRSIPSVPI